MIMRKMWVYILIILLALVNDWYGRPCYGCLEEERIGLLEIKASFDPNAISWRLRDWVDNKEDIGNCCEWSGIQCDNSTKRVIQLDLSATRFDQDEFLASLFDQDEFSASLFDNLILNASLFLPFTKLQSLDLSVNNIVGCFENEDFQVLSPKLRKLEVLDLSNNQFNDSIISCLNGFSSLKSLYLSGNELTGSAGFYGFEVLSSRLKKLENLDLRWNGYNDSRFFSSLNGFSSLKSLDLSHNRLTGSTSVNGVHVLPMRLRKLEDLDLSYNELTNSSISSILSGLPSLKSLDLSVNMLTSTSFNGFEVLSSMQLRKLEYLDLSSNQLDDNILSCLSGFSSLKTLNLSYNIMLSGSTGVNGKVVNISSHPLANILQGLRKLETLNLDLLNITESILLGSLGALSSLKTLSLTSSQLSRTSISKGTFLNSTTLEELFLDESSFPLNILQNIGALSGLKVLSATLCYLNGALPAKGTFFNSTTVEELYLDDSLLPRNILQNIGPLSALKVLSVAGCDLKGTLPAKGLCELKNLKQLSLHGNNLEGSLPNCLGNLSSLQLLDVSRNQFRGNIAYGPLTNLASLEFLSLSDNHFEVPLSFKSFMNHSNLKFFISDNNILIPDEPTTFHNFIPKFQLLYLSLSNSTSKPLIVEIPNFLYNQYDLKTLDLSYNHFSGMFPSWLLENNTRLEELYLMENSFIGPFQLQSHPNPKMEMIDISNNNIDGQISKNMSVVFPNLSLLRMANNELQAFIPSCFGNMSKLYFLDLSNNQLSTVNLEQLTRLEFLKLSNNNLSGQIPPSIFNSSTLNSLYLGGNNFSGQLSDLSPIIWRRRGALDLSNNQFSGMLPRWISNVSFQAIDLSKNHFEGPITEGFCKFDALTYLDLSENNLNGSIPSCLINSPNLVHVHLSKNQLSGPLTQAFHNSSSLVTLDLKDNNFVGSIPNWIGNLSSLSVLLLKANQFDCELPIQLCLLEDLSILDVSQNKLSGPLPSCLSNLTFKPNFAKTIVISGMSYLFKFFSEGDTIYAAMGIPLFRTSVDHIYGKENSYPSISYEEEVEFTTKRMSYGYKGHILNFMSGIDLSSNNFSGEIPQELGTLSEIHALNLSHNNLIGSIPVTFSNLSQMESLDLSHNNLSGGIPQQLAQMTSLEVFSVAHNNLSGKTPEQKFQFGTFDESSYEGNPLLCGPPLKKNCSEEESPTKPMPNAEQEDDGFMDMDVFYVSFGVCYTIVVLAIAAVLYINPYWRRRWFHFIEKFMDTCYCFMVINFRKLSNFRKS